MLKTDSLLDSGSESDSDSENIQPSGITVLVVRTKAIIMTPLVTFRPLASGILGDRIFGPYSAPEYAVR